MIKLIATDLDGTLLQQGAQTVSERVLEQITTLKNLGIVFVAASGRQYPNLYRLFGRASKDMAFICENGALVMYQDKIISKKAMDQTLARAVIDDIYNREGCEVLISGEVTSYLKPKSDTYLHRMQNIVKNNVVIVDQFSDIKEDIIKVSVYEEAGIMEHSAGYFIDKWDTKLKCTVSGHGWLDFVNKDVNKGTAIHALTDSLSIPQEATMAFGDNYNDLEMLSYVNYGYAMENAAEDIKNRYSYCCALVEDTLDEVLANLSDV